MKRIFLIVIFLPLTVLGQHIIHGKFSPPEDYNVALLYKATPTVSEYITNSEIAEDGAFKFVLDSTATKGSIQRRNERRRGNKH